MEDGLSFVFDRGREAGRQIYIYMCVCVCNASCVWAAALCRQAESKPIQPPAAAAAAAAPAPAASTLAAVVPGKPPLVKGMKQAASFGQVKLFGSKGMPATHLADLNCSRLVVSVMDGRSYIYSFLFSSSLTLKIKKPREISSPADQSLYSVFFLLLLF